MYRYREATSADIPQIQVVRHLVKENRLSDPALVTDADCEHYLHQRGKGWVCEQDGTVVGFAIVDLQDHNVWALFVDPAHAERGIGKQLQTLMLDWYFLQSSETLWLSTAPGTRAERFYELSGWTKTGVLKNGEMRFEMRKEDWHNISS